MDKQNPTLFPAKSFQLPVYGWVGLAIIIISQLFCWMKFNPFYTFNTPFCWTGYILLIDSIIYQRKKESFILTRTGDFIVLLVLSVIFWLVFELYNILIKNWHYSGLPPNKLIRYFGYTWSFATIWPAIFETCELLDLLIPNKKYQVPKYRLISNQFVFWSIFTGLICLIYPVMSPSPYLFGYIWIGFILLLEPINYTFDRPSLLFEWRHGSVRKFWILMLAGYLCGLLWEFWNYWAGAQWHYTVPIGPRIYIFEMPIVGFLGFGPFAVECYVLYSAATGLQGWGKVPPAVQENSKHLWNNNQSNKRASAS